MAARNRRHPGYTFGGWALDVARMTIFLFLLRHAMRALQLPIPKGSLAS